ncbi:MAG: LacI family DNA-binding transcriptional regulator [Spirochaetia bacterium]|jgi:DNA-binding LacI/PurR family transcriptional regulator|nr:LacI family DNA-binding transcriptional regulator [Spirochaetia bacterium]
MSKPTLLDIAKLAGVSPSTASLVLAKKGKISNEVREKVKIAADELGYTKKAVVNNTKSKTIAVLFHFDSQLSQTWNILRQVTLSLEETLSHSNYLTILIPITYDMSDSEIFKKVIDSRAIAVFSMHFGREKLFSQLENVTIPVVIIINSHFQSHFYTVCADNFQGSYEAASHLLQLGHKNIIYADFDIYQLPETLSDRFFGFYKALNEHQITLSDEHKLHFDINNVTDIRSKFTKAFSTVNKPTAIFFVDDYLAAHSMGVLKEMGLNCPDDISIIASGEVLDYKEPYIPQITGMVTRPDLLGKFSAEMMLNRLKHKPSESYVLKIKQQLMERGSCRKI